MGKMRERKRERGAMFSKRIYVGFDKQPKVGSSSMFKVRATLNRDPIVREKKERKKE